MIYRYSHLRNQSLTESIFLHGPDNKILNLLISTHQKLLTIQRINWKVASPWAKKRFLSKCPGIRIVLELFKPSLSEKELIPGDSSGRGSEVAHPLLEDGKEGSGAGVASDSAFSPPFPQPPGILSVTPTEPCCPRQSWSRRDTPCQRSPISEHSQKF